MKRSILLLVWLLVAVALPGCAAEVGTDPAEEEAAEDGLAPDGDGYGEDSLESATTGFGCIKHVDAASGIAWTECSNIEPWYKQRIKVRLYDRLTGVTFATYGPWITQNNLESIKLWNIWRYLYVSSRVVVVYA